MGAAIYLFLISHNAVISFYVLNLVDIFINHTFWIENGYTFLSEPMDKYD